MLNLEELLYHTFHMSLEWLIILYTLAGDLTNNMNEEVIFQDSSKEFYLCIR